MRKLYDAGHDAGVRAAEAKTRRARPSQRLKKNLAANRSSLAIAAVASVARLQKMPANSAPGVLTEFYRRAEIEVVTMKSAFFPMNSNRASEKISPGPQSPRQP
jgi:hypothetical protein